MITRRPKNCYKRTSKTMQKGYESISLEHVHKVINAIFKYLNNKWYFVIPPSSRSTKPFMVTLHTFCFAPQFAYSK